MRHRDAQKPRDNVQHVDIRLDPVGLVIAVRGARAADLPRDDPLGDALRRAAAGGVNVMAMECTVTPDSLTITRPVPVRL